VYTLFDTERDDSVGGHTADMTRKDAMCKRRCQRRMCQGLVNRITVSDNSRESRYERKSQEPRRNKKNNKLRFRNWQGECQNTAQLAGFLRKKEKGPISLRKRDRGRNKRGDKDDIKESCLTFSIRSASYKVLELKKMGKRFTGALNK